MDTLEHEKEIQEYVKSIEHLKKQNKKTEHFCSEIKRLEKKLQELKKNVYSKLTPWERIQICRHPKRPHAIDYIKNLCGNSFLELCGDRNFRDDRALIGGIGFIDQMKCVVLGQEKGCDTESRIHHNFGMMHPEGYRKALRLMKLAEKFHLPVITFLDTPGAYPCLEAEERGQGWAIAQNLLEMARLKTPIIVVVIGEGCSGGALGIGVGDSVGMLEHAYYSVITPEGCASILWKDPSKRIDAASALKLNAEHLHSFNIIDTIIKEPLGGAHHNPQETFSNVKHFVLEQWQKLKMIPTQILTEQRYQKYRELGAVDCESRHLQESSKINHISFGG
ncbi:MAG: acetyl-CoA carboxylase carboxyltransferase subunit alpha [Chlamydiales bacterium]